MQWIGWVDIQIYFDSLPSQLAYCQLSPEAENLHLVSLAHQYLTIFVCMYLCAIYRIFVLPPHPVWYVLAVKTRQAGDTALITNADAFVAVHASRSGLCDQNTQSTKIALVKMVKVPCPTFTMHKHALLQLLCITSTKMEAAFQHPTFAA